jgi:hypothetical protein
MLSSGLLSPAIFVESTTSRDLIRIIRGRIVRRARGRLNRILQTLHLIKPPTGDVPSQTTS